MALDAANFIAELSITDPPGSDPLSQGDDQIRTIKRATFQSFPLVAAAVNITDAQMNLMAIKNEANVFTADQEIRSHLRLNADTDVSRFIAYEVSGVPRWLMRMGAVAENNNFTFRRNDSGGLLVDIPWECDLTTGIIDFAQVPTVQGAPLWIAGELRMFVAGVSIGANWFLANGANGTVNIANHVIMASGTSPGGTFLAPNLTGVTVSAASAATALTEAQMPSHRHRIRSGGASGITDVALGNVSTQTVVGANRGNTSSQLFDTNSGGQTFIENTGSSSSHAHTVNSAAVIESGTGRDTVRPLSFVAAMYQYVP